MHFSMKRVGCSVGILRPPATEMSRLLSDQVDRKREVGEAEQAAHLDEQIDQMAEMFRMAVEGLGMHLNITQYQLHGTDRLRVLSRKRTRNVRENDILATIDPPPSVYAFTTGLQGNPLQRAVLAYTDAQEFADSAQLLGSNVVHMVGKQLDEHTFALRRVFALYTSPDEATAANRFDRNAKVVRQAVLYPEIPPDERPRNDGEIVIPFDRLGEDDCRGLFRESRSKNA
ncbi:MAG TPA: hypothetical protein PKV72_05565 [Candidatus Peribacteria bacterium]|nr:hypothetical protein [Candidatus Peribacteria bacterium]